MVICSFIIIASSTNREYASGGLRSGGLATAPKCMLQTIVARTWRKHGLLQHLPGHAVRKHVFSVVFLVCLSLS